MKKVLLVFLCLVPSIIASMAADEPKSKHRRYSVMYTTPVIEDTRILQNKVEEEGLAEVKSDLENQKKQLALELGIAHFLLQTSKLSPEVKKGLEKRMAKLDWQKSLSDVLYNELERKELIREQSIYDELQEASAGLGELDDELLEDELRNNLSRAIQMKKIIEQQKQRVIGAQKQIRPEAEGRLNSVVTTSPKPHFAHQSYN